MEFDNSESEDDTTQKGFHHMNDSGTDTLFNLDLFGLNIEIQQAPDLPPLVAKDVGHGAVVWDAAIIFAKYLEHSPKFSGNSLEGKRIIELGAGTGLSGLTMMLKGGIVTLTDTKAVLEHITIANA